MQLFASNSLRAQNARDLSAKEKRRQKARDQVSSVIIRFQAVSDSFTDAALEKIGDLPEQRVPASAAMARFLNREGNAR